MIRHHFTVDVEEYFQVYALSPHVPRGSWDHIPSRLERPVDRLLEDVTGQPVLGYRW